MAPGWVASAAVLKRLSLPATSLFAPAVRHIHSRVLPFCGPSVAGWFSSDYRRSVVGFCATPHALVPAAVRTRTALRQTIILLTSV